MIIVHITAGMGNQMFMYAAGLSTASRLNTELCLDTMEIKGYSQPKNSSDAAKSRYYMLQYFPNIKERDATLQEVWRLCSEQAAIDIILGKRTLYWRIFRRIIVNRLVVKLRNSYQENPSKAVYAPLKSNTYSPDFENLHDNTYLKGFWENEKYFAGIKNLVREKFRFPPECFNPKLADKIKSCNSIALHVRRGDKVNNQSFFPSKEDYIKHSIERISALTSSPKFFVFSDDIEWCKINLPKIYNSDYTFIENQTPHQDMALITICKHVIMGPSTFSWWGAWLNENPDKIIIAPDLHLWVKGITRSDDLLPHEWIRLS